MIVLICDNYPTYDNNGLKTGLTEYVVSHGYDIETGKSVVLPQVPPQDLGAIYKNGEWVLE